MSDEQKKGAGNRPPELARVDINSVIILRRRIADGVLLIDLDFGGDKGPYLPASSFGISIPTFESNEQAEAWIDRLIDLFFDRLKGGIVDAATLLLNEAAGAAAIEEGIAPYDKQGLLASHVALTEVLSRRRLGLLPASPWPPWTAQELALSILQAMRAAPLTNPTYPTVAKRLQAMFPGRPPTTGEALRKVVEKYGINWMKLKRQARKTESDVN